jgi:hypothetical protein
VIRTVLVRSPEVLEYKLSQTERGVAVSIVTSGPAPALAGLLESALAASGLSNPQVDLHPVKRLDRDRASAKLRLSRCAPGARRARSRPPGRPRAQLWSRRREHGSPIDVGLSRVALWRTFERVVQPWSAASVRHRVDGGVGIHPPAPGRTRLACSVMARLSSVVVELLGN